MLIEKISLKSNRNANVFIVQIEGNDYILHSDVIVKHGLRTNGQISLEELQNLIFESNIIIATNLAMNYISTKLITVKQLKDYLRKKGYEYNVISQVIDKCKEYGVVNDENFAHAFVELKQSSLSKRAITNKLMQKGVDKEIAKTCLEDFDEYDVAVKTAEKFMKTKPYTEENIAKLLRHLNYKGFDYDVINKTLNYLKNNYKNN